MLKIGLIKEGKIPPDNRVPLTPAQCKWIRKNFPDIRILVQSSVVRCFSDKEYGMAGTEVKDDISECEVLFGIKEIPVDQFLPGKTYLFFSHTKKKQSHNQKMLQEIIRKKITLIDYECLEHEDGQRIIGFGFFAGVVGAHNGIMAYGNRTGLFKLGRVYQQRSFRELIHTYFGLKLPNIKIAVTGSGRVAHGILEVMNLLEIHEVEPDEYLQREYSYPVYVQLKGADLYEHKSSGSYSRQHFHEQPEEFRCKFLPYAFASDVLMNGVYWDKNIPRLFDREMIQDARFRIQVIADVTDDEHGSIPINLGDQTMEDPIYGVDKKTFKKTKPGLPGSIDLMAVGNLPNELPRDASRYFGEQLIKFVIPNLTTGSAIMERATMVREGKLTAAYEYLREYAGV
jgi:saccharopine dehydrogenase (NAD+, L-lysine forming)